MSRLSFLNMLARRVLRGSAGRVSRPIVRLSMFGVSLGVTIMLIAVGVTSGYKKIIEEKVVAMGQHICISHYDNNHSFEQVPINFNDTIKNELRQYPEIAGFQPFATKVGIIKTDDQVEGIVLKGVDTSFNWKLFNTNIIEGGPVTFNDSAASGDIIISKKISDKLKIKVGDKVRTYFVQDPPRQRSFKVSGIYETGMPEFDSKIAIVDLRHVQKLNDWSAEQVSGIEVLTNDYGNVDATGEKLHQNLDVTLKAQTIKQTYPEIFGWIALFDTNVSVLLTITTVVCVISMLSVFFIIILEQTKLIGILKTLGMRTSEIVGTFIMVAGYTLARGLLVGNAIAIGIGLLQQKHHLVKLDPDTYYIDFVPINFELWQVLLLNVGVFAACLLVIALPAWFVSRKIQPAKAVRFE